MLDLQPPPKNTMEATNLQNERRLARDHAVEKLEKKKQEYKEAYDLYMADLNEEQQHDRAYETLEKFLKENNKVLIASSPSSLQNSLFVLVSLF